MKQPKFKTGDILYYVNPFVYNIEKILVQFIEEPTAEDEKIYYIDNDGAYLAEWDLFHSLTHAKEHAQVLLEKFYAEHTRMIKIANPELHLEPED
jgi:hypothetical protein